MSKQQSTPGPAERATATDRSGVEVQERLWDQVADWCEATARRLREGDWDRLLEDMQQGLRTVAATGRVVPWRPREFRVARNRQPDELTLMVVFERTGPEGIPPGLERRGP